MSGTAQKERATHARTNGDSGRFDREIGRARRHTLLVRLLRFGLPAAAVAIVAGGVVVTWAARRMPENVSVAAATIDSRGIVMQDPRMSGFDRNNRPYTMIAERAIQQLGGGLVDLEKIKANVAVSDSSTADIVAAKGAFDQAGQKLRLADDIHVQTSDGMTVSLSSADIDLKTGSLAGRGPVEIVSDERTITAGSIAVRDGGKGLSFGERVRMTIRPAASRRAEADTSSNLSSVDPARFGDFSKNDVR
ncbi:LPS export ABC transporter periplasmic protein LptC [Aureimonas leprariae]|uniref:LPS export ABC transporter periplasmic protein LptC n=1 Tax=Plantimonas leprariae TaxID=2615207 RepID=UPI0013868199|nr:LPS export ABC transporter periplasmic protein LptC [Aureimonas leprariae]